MTKSNKDNLIFNLKKVLELAATGTKRIPSLPEHRLEQLAEIITKTGIIENIEELEKEAVSYKDRQGDSIVVSLVRKNENKETCQLQFVKINSSRPHEAQRFDAEVELLRLIGS